MLFEVGRIDAPPSRHSEVKHERVSAIRVDQAVFGAAAETGNVRSNEPLTKIYRERATKVRPPCFDRGDSPAGQHTIKAANGGFDFGQFRHWRDMAERRQAR